MKALIYASLVATLSFLHCDAFAEEWKFLNGPTGGYVTSFFEPPVGGLFCGTICGIYGLQSDSSWKPVLLGAEVSGFARDSLGNIYTAGGAGICRSKDGGAHWDTLLSNEYNFLATQLVIFSDSVIVATNGRSTDLGKTWTQDSFFVNTYFMHDLVYDQKRGFLYVLNGYLYCSTDEGNSWQKTNASFGMSHLTETASGTLFCTESLKGIYSSSDNGDSWKHLHTGIQDIDSAYLDVQYAGGVLMVQGYPTRGFYWSTDEGATWSYCIDGLPNGTVTSVSFNASTNRWYAGTDGTGAFTCATLAGHWEMINKNLFCARCYDLAVDSSGGIYSLYRGTVARSIDEGHTWEQYSTGLPVDFIPGNLAVSPNDTLMFLSLSALYASSDRGRTWQQRWPFSIGSFVFERNGGMFGCNYDVFHSTNHGATWDTLLDYYRPLWSLNQAPNGSVFVAGPDGIFRSTDWGVSWSAVLGWGNDYGWFAAASPNGDVYCGKQNYGILRSTDNGTSWRSSNNGVPYEYFSVDHIAFNANGAVFINTDEGVYYSTNRGDSWQLFGTAADTRQARTITMDNRGYLYKLMDEGVYRSTESTLNLKTAVMANTKMPFSYALSPNYPNPFNPQTTISYSIPQESFVRVEVFNLLGQSVAVLVEEKKSPGSYTVNWNAGMNASGIYFYKIGAVQTNGGQAEMYSSTRKMVLIR